MGVGVAVGVGVGVGVGVAVSVGVGVTGGTGSPVDSVGVVLGFPAWTEGSDVVGSSVATSLGESADPGAASVTSASRGAVPLPVRSPTRGSGTA